MPVPTMLLMVPNRSRHALSDGHSCSRFPTLVPSVIPDTRISQRILAVFRERIRFHAGSNHAIDGSR